MPGTVGIQKSMTKSAGEEDGGGIRLTSWRNDIKT